MPSNAPRPDFYVKKTLKVTVVFLAVALLTTLIKTIPEFGVMLKDQRKALPASFAIVLKASELLRDYGWLLLVASIPMALYNWRTKGALVGTDSVKVLATILVLEIAALGFIVFAAVHPILQIGEI